LTVFHLNNRSLGHTSTPTLAGTNKKQKSDPSNYPADHFLAIHTKRGFWSHVSKKKNLPRHQIIPARATLIRTRRPYSRQPSNSADGALRMEGTAAWKCVTPFNPHFSCALGEKKRDLGSPPLVSNQGFFDILPPTVTAVVHIRPFFISVRVTEPIKPATLRWNKLGPSWQSEMRM